MCRDYLTFHYERPSTTHMSQGVNVEWFYLLLYSIALRLPCDVFISVSLFYMLKKNTFIYF